MQYKLLLRLYITPRILNKMNSNHSPLCNKSQSEIGTFMHCFWHCPVITKSWDGVVRKMGDIFKINFTKAPVFFFGLPAKDIALTANRFLLCDKLLLLARKCILIEWIHSRPPSLCQTCVLCFSSLLFAYALIWFSYSCSCLV